MRSRPYVFVASDDEQTGVPSELLPNQRTAGRLAMPVKTASKPDEEPSDTSNDSDFSLFRKVQSDDDICGNCFRRTHNSFQRNYAVDIYKVDHFEWETWARKVDLPDDRIPEWENRESVPATPVTLGMRGLCACGFPPGEQLRPLPKSLFFEYANHLIDRYSEIGIQFDETRFLDVLKKRKTDPSEQFADDKLYDEATDESLV